ncbi:MAG: LytTR family transcriptional regulator DNA-binding domain-containing protein [Bacteroidia bacterium]
MLSLTKTPTSLLICLLVCLVYSCDTKLRQENKNLKKKNETLQKRIEEKDNEIQQWVNAHAKLKQSHNQVVSEKNSLKNHLNQANRDKKVLKETIEDLDEDLLLEKLVKKGLLETQQLALVIWLLLVGFLILSILIIRHYAGSNRKLHTTVHQKRLIIADWEQHNGQVEEQLDKVQSEVEKKQQQLETSQVKYHNLMKDYEQNLTITKNLKAEYGQIQVRIKAADELLIDQQLTIESLKESLKEEQKQLAQTKSELEKTDYQNQLTNKNLQQKLETTNRALADAKVIIETLKNDNQAKKNQLNITEAKLQKLTEDYGHITNINERLDSKRNQLHTENLEKKSIIKDLETQIQQEKEKVTQARSEIKQLEKSNLENQVSIKSLQKELELTQKELSQAEKTIDDLKSIQKKLVIVEGESSQSQPEDNKPYYTKWLNVFIENPDHHELEPKKPVSFKDVALIESKGKGAIITTISKGPKYETSYYLGWWKKKLITKNKDYKKNFIHVNKSYLVNIEAIVGTPGSEKKDRTTYTKREPYITVNVRGNRKKIPVGDNFREEVEKILMS